LDNQPIKSVAARPELTVWIVSHAPRQFSGNRSGNARVAATRFFFGPLGGPAETEVFHDCQRSAEFRAHTEGMRMFGAHRSPHIRDAECAYIRSSFFHMLCNGADRPRRMSAVFAALVSSHNSPTTAKIYSPGHGNSMTNIIDAKAPRRVPPQSPSAGR
jgi:hypothetical protein